MSWRLAAPENPERTATVTRDLATPEPCTINGSTRHRSTNLAPVINSIYITGRVGTSLCGYRVYDEAAATANFGVPIVLADLDACRRCEPPARARRAQRG